MKWLLWHLVDKFGVKHDHDYYGKTVLGPLTWAWSEQWGVSGMFLFGRPLWQNL